MNSVCDKCRIDNLEVVILELEDKLDTLDMDFTRWRLEQAIQNDDLIEKINKLETLLIKIILKN